MTGYFGAQEPMTFLMVCFAMTESREEDDGALLLFG